MKEKFNLKEKTVIIIGASGRIGSAICEALSHTGANIVAADIEDSKLKEENSSYLPLKVDITDISSIKSVFKKSLKKYSKVDSAINVSYPKNKNYGSLFENVKYEDFCENVSLHLGGYFLFLLSLALVKGLAPSISLLSASSFSLETASIIISQPAFLA